MSRALLLLLGLSALPLLLAADTPLTTTTCCPCPTTSTTQRPPPRGAKTPVSSCPPCEQTQTCNCNCESKDEKAYSPPSVIRIPVVIKQVAPHRNGDKVRDREGQVTADRSYWPNPINLFTFFLVLFTGMQAYVLHEQFRRTETIERPWLMVRVEPVIDEDRQLEDIMEILKEAALRKPVPVVVRGIAINDGQGQGWMVKTLSIPRLFFANHPLDTQEPRTEEDVRRLLVPCPEFAIPPEYAHRFEAFWLLTPEEHARIRAGRASLIFLALFEYRGPIRKTLWRGQRATIHETWFCWEWTCRPLDDGQIAQVSGPGEPKHWTKYT